MKVLLVNDYGTPTGGAELQMLALRDGLRARGHDARLFTTRASAVPGELLADEHCFGTIGRLQVLSQMATFLGHLPRTELEQRFDAAWVQAVPSLWDEPFGNVTTEAMARGTAVVASAVGAQPEIVRAGETGFLVPPNDAAALAEALLRVLGDRMLAERLAGRVARSRGRTSAKRG